MNRDAPGELGAIEPEWDEAVDEVPTSFAPKPATDHVANLEQIVSLAKMAGRTEALLEAAEVVRARAVAMPTYALGETKALINASNAILALNS